MYEQLMAGLRAKFPGLPDKYLERKATQLAKTTTTTEQVKTAIDGVSFQDIIDSEGDRRANDAQQTAVKNYENKHHLKDGKPVEPTQPNNPPAQPAQPNNQNGGGDDTPAWAKAWQKTMQQQAEQVKALQEKLDAMQGEKTANTRRSQYEALFAKITDETTKERYLRDFDRLSFKDDEDFNTWLAERTPIITQEVDTLLQQGAVTTSPKGGQQGKPAGEASQGVKDYIEAAASRANAQSYSSIVGLPTTGGGAQ